MPAAMPCGCLCPTTDLGTAQQTHSALGSELLQHLPQHLPLLMR